jgi:hypothetical protein
MSQEVPPGDMLFGSVVLAIFLVFVFALGWLINKFKNRRFTRAWTPLVPLIQGTVHEDGGGGGFLSGTYRGHKVRATTRFGQPEVSYQARGKTLLYSEDVTPNWIPAPERFQEELELLLALARINAEVNPA